MFKIIMNILQYTNQDFALLTDHHYPYQFLELNS